MEWCPLRCLKGVPTHNLTNRPNNSAKALPSLEALDSNGLICLTWGLSLLLDPLEVFPLLEEEEDEVCTEEGRREEGMETNPSGSSTSIEGVASSVEDWLEMGAEGVTAADEEAVLFVWSFVKAVSFSSWCLPNCHEAWLVDSEQRAKRTVDSQTRDV